MLKRKQHSIPDVYSILFDRILKGYYPPSTKLIEEQIAEEFNISRTPVREILNQLASDGLVQKTPKKGCRVLGFTVDDIEEVYELRKLLEVHALRCSFSFLSIQKLKAFKTEIQSIKNSSDYLTHEKMDSELHNYFIQASGRSRLIHMLEQLNRLLHQFRVLGFKSREPRDQGTQQHTRLIDALILRDIETAIVILEQHIDTGKKNAIMQL